MAKKKSEPKIDRNIKGVEGLHAETVEQPICQTLEQNFMPYAMSVIVSRAIPEIDGFKPSHRKLLYTMYKMGLLNGPRTKSANIVGQTMRLNPHGDAAIYETMVRLARGNETLLQALSHAANHRNENLAALFACQRLPACNAAVNLLFGICADRTRVYHHRIGRFVVGVVLKKLVTC